MKNILILFLFITTSCFSQSKYTLVKTIEVTSDFFTTDNQSNIYTVKGNELTKYDKTGKQLYKYSNKNLSNITSVDASNMLKILVFYKDFLQVVFLDNTLSQNGEPVSLDKLGLQQTQLVCSSHNSGMWMYDQQNFALIRLDQDLQKSQQVNNLTAIVHDTLQPNLLVEYNNNVYMNNPYKGIMIFDVYGTYYKTIPVQNVSQFQPIGDWVYYLVDKNVKAYHVKTTEEKEFEMPLTEFQNFRLEMGVLVLRTATSISIFSEK
jgi:hypothetical protein